MTIPEEIEQLKTQLERTADDEEQAEVLLALLKKYASINSIDSKPYVERLLQLAAKIVSVRFNAWGLFYQAVNYRLIGEFDASLSLLQQALLLFEQIDDKPAIAHVYNNIGNISLKRSSYSEARENYFRVLQISEETGDKQATALPLNNIAITYEYQGNYPDALKYHLRALQLFEQTGNKARVAWSYNNIGNVHRHLSNYPEALKYQLKALQIREEIDDKHGTATSYNNIGNIHYAQGNYPEALKNQIKGLQIREEIGDREGRAMSHNNIGNIHMERGSYPEALKNHKKALRIREELSNKRGIGQSLNNIGSVMRRQGNYNDALKSHLHAAQVLEAIGEKQELGVAYNNIGDIHFKQGHYDEALKYQLSALEIGKEIGDVRLTAACYNTIGELYEKQGNRAEALSNKLRSLQLSEEIGEKEITKNTSLSLSSQYKAISDFENALKYHEKYHQVESEMLGEESKKQLNNLSFMHNLEQKEKDLEIEQLRNVELKKERDRSESLLLNILPSEVAEELKEKGTAGAKLFDDVTVLFTDFVGFTKVAERLTPQQLVDELHACFSAFDDIMHRHNIEKIKTVGDAYLAVSGLPLANSNHAENLVKAAIEIRDFMLERKGRAPLAIRGTKEGGKSLETFEVRIGVHSGSVVAGIVGVKKFAYDIWGDTVNTAARMEQNSEAGKINISQTTYELVKDKFTCEYRGEIEAKNKGLLKMYFVE